MKTIAFFNNKGGVGTTTLVYQLASMFADLGVRVVAVDLDPQASLTAMSLPIDTLAAIESDEQSSIYDVIAPVISADPPILPEIYEVAPGFGLLPGDLDLSIVEDALSTAWAETRNDSPLVRGRGMRSTTALAQAVRDAGTIYDADLALIDVGPNVGAINRAAILGADFVVVPVAPDIFSFQGLVNGGRALRDWRDGWASRSIDTPAPAGVWPTGLMTPLGYVISRFTFYNGDKARHPRGWINRVPAMFSEFVLGSEPSPALTVEDDAACLAWLKDYHALMAMAHDSRKPIFRLKPADGAIGGHQQAVLAAYKDYAALARTIATRVGVPIPPL